MQKSIKNAFLMMLVMTVITGFIYPLTVTGIARVFFPRQADGITVKKGEATVGYQLIGQKFDLPQYFHSRPSAAGQGYEANKSGGSNLGPTNPELLQTVGSAAQDVRKENELPPKSAIPADMVTSSGSGIDPHISPESANLQISRVAKTRNVPKDKVRELVDECIEGRQLGIGERRVNVLLLNVKLDMRMPTTDYENIEWK